MELVKTPGSRHPDYRCSPFLACHSDADRKHPVLSRGIFEDQIEYIECFERLQQVDEQISIIFCGHLHYPCWFTSAKYGATTQFIFLL
jgi:hypothetical protein